MDRKHLGFLGYMINGSYRIAAGAYAECATLEFLKFLDHS